ncbi:hypothetical protein [Herpetosiphon gulosus]|uniref:Uncharacterized protein n=1 Tax=Herpetosiphon gulosus TaxID=1973496 RepID=A0ABP9X6A8_9CHLR
MQDFWQRVQALAGQTLATTAQHRLFTILSVDADELWLEPHSTRKKRWLRRNDFEVLLQSEVNLKHLTRANIAEYMPNARFNTAYVYTILAHLGIIDD